MDSRDGGYCRGGGGASDDVNLSRSGSFDTGYSGLDECMKECI